MSSVPGGRRVTATGSMQILKVNSVGSKLSIPLLVPSSSKSTEGRLKAIQRRGTRENIARDVGRLNAAGRRLSVDRMHMDPIVALAENCVSLILEKLKQHATQLRYQQLFKDIVAQGELEGYTFPSVTEETRQPGKQLPADQYVVKAGEVRDTLESVTRALAERCGPSAVECFFGGTKRVERAEAKADRRYGGDLSGVLDYARTSIVLKDLASIRACVQAADDWARQDPSCPFTIARIKSLFSTEEEALPGGYRDVKLNLKIQEHICEVQLHLQPMWAVAGQDGYGLYQVVAGQDEDGNPILLTSGLEILESSLMTEETLMMMMQIAARRAEEPTILIPAILARQGKAKAAMEEYQKAVAHYEAKGQPDHPTVTWSKRGITEILLTQNESEEAVKHAATCVERSSKLYGPEHPETTSDTFLLASANAKNGKFAEAERCYRQVLERRREVLGEEDAKTQEVECELAALLAQKKERSEEAETLFRKVLASREDRLGSRHVLTLEAAGQVAFICSTRGKYAEAEPMYTRCMEGFEEAYGSSHPLYLTSTLNLAKLLQELRRYAEAAKLFEKVLESCRTLYGPTHEETLIAQKCLGMSLYRSKRYEEAEKLLQGTLEAREKSLGKDDERTISTMVSLGSVLIDAGKVDEGIQHLRQALDLYAQTLGEDSAAVVDVLQLLAGTLEANGEREQALKYFKRALNAAENVSGKESHDIITFSSAVGHCLTSLGRSREAEPHLRRALDLSSRLQGNRHKETLSIENELASVLGAELKVDEAIDLYKETLAGRSEVCGPKDLETLSTAYNLAILLHKTEKLKEAESLYQQAITGYEEILGPKHPHTLDAANNLASLFAVQENYAAAEPLFRQAVAGREEQLGSTDSSTLASFHSLGSMLYRQEKYSEAVPILKKGFDGRKQVLGQENSQFLSTMYYYAMSMARLGGKEAEATALCRECVALMRKNPATMNEDRVLELEEAAQELTAKLKWQRITSIFCCAGSQARVSVETGA